VGLRCCIKRVGTRLRCCNGEIQKRVRKTPGRVLVLGTNYQPNGTSGTLMSTHLLRIPVTPNHQYLPKLFLSSPQDQVREDRVVRELQPCGELVTMPCKVESKVEFAPVLFKIHNRSCVL